MSKELRPTIKRGKKLFDDLINEGEVEVSAFEGKNGRGRCELLIYNRNKCLLYRYYYYTKILRRKYDDVLLCLKDEFFLTPRTIINISVEKKDFLISLSKEKIGVKELEKKYPYLNWKN